MPIRKFLVLFALLTVAALPQLGTAQAAGLIANGPPDLTVDLTAAPTPVAAAGAVTYTLQVGNSTIERCKPGLEPICVTTGRAVSGVAVTFTLPSGAAFQTAVGDHGFTCPSAATQGGLTCSGGSLAPDDLATIRITLTAPAQTGTMTAGAVVDPSNTVAERSETNNSASLAVTVRPAGPRAYVLQTPTGAQPSIAVLETDTSTVVNVVPIPSGSLLAEAPGGALLYVLDFASHSLALFDTSSNTLGAPLPLGLAPRAIAFSPDGGRVYVGGDAPTGGAVAILDAGANTSVGNVPIGPQDLPESLAVSPDGARLYVGWSTNDHGAISVVDTATRTVAATLPAGTDASVISLALTPDGRRLYVTNGAGMFVLDTGTYAVLARPGGAREHPVATPDGTQIYSLDSFNGRLTAVATASNALTSLTLPGSPDGLAVSADSTRLYVTCGASKVVTVVDTATNRVIGNVPLADTPAGVAVPPPPSRARAYVANTGSNSVSVIDRVSSKVTATVPVGVGPEGVALTPDGRRAYVANTTSSTVSVIDTLSNTVTATIGVGQAPMGMAVRPDGARAYVANFASHTLSVMDTVTNQVVATVPTGDAPERVAVSPDGKSVYVANQGGGSVTVIDASTNAVLTTISVGGVPGTLAFAPNGGRAYVALRQAGLAVIDTATRTVVTTIAVPWAYGVVVAPDGGHVYATQFALSQLAVIDATTNTVQTTLPIGRSPVVHAMDEDGARLYVADTGDSGVATTVYVVDTLNNAVLGSISVGATPADIALGLAPRA